MQVLKLDARVQPEFFKQHLPRVLVGVKGVGLPAAAVQAEHQAGAQPLAQGVLSDQLAEFRNQVRVQSGREVDIDPLFEYGYALLLQPVGQPAQDWRAGVHVRQRRTPPQRQSPLIQAPRLREVPVARRFPRSCDQAVQGMKIQLTVRDAQLIARRLREDPVGRATGLKPAEYAAQLVDMRLQVLAAPRR